MDLATIARLANSVPALTQLYGAIQRAQRGDPEALAYLKSQGCFEALDLFRPGAGTVAKQVVEQGQSAWSSIQGILAGNIIEGEARVISGPPWRRFARWLVNRRWGTFVVLGPKGQGKSTLALRLAEIWHQQTGWPVELVMGYPEDIYDFVTPVPTKQFLRDIRAIIRVLDPPLPKKGEKEDNEDDGEELVDERSPEEINRQLSRFKRRIIVVDEMSLTVGTSGADAGRIMVRQLMAQARHLNLLICYIGQLAKMLPNDLLSCEAVFVKQPNGREIETDREDRLTRLLWRDATQGFAATRQSEWYEYYPDIRAWSWVDCLDMGTGKGYRGMLPVSMPGSGNVTLTEEDEDDDVAD